MERHIRHTILSNANVAPIESRDTFTLFHTSWSATQPSYEATLHASHGLQTSNTWIVPSPPITPNRFIMSLRVLRLSCLITVCTSTHLPSTLLPASPMTMSAILSGLHSQPVIAGSGVIMSTHIRHTRRHHTLGLSVARTTYLESFACHSPGNPHRIIHVEGNRTAMPTVEPRSLAPIDVLSSIPSNSTPAVTTASAFSEIPLVSSDASSGPSFHPNSNTSESGPISHPSLHPAIIPAFVGSAMGAVVLTAMTLLIVCRRRSRSQGKSEPGDAGCHSWFKSDKKDGVVFLHVPPPTVPLKGILINSPPPIIDDNASSDRISLTSSQMSVLINKLPKSYDSGLEDGVLDEVREHGGNSSIKVVRRIGPSSSDFISTLFGLSHADSFSSSTSCASARSTIPQGVSLHLPPRSPPQSQPDNVAYSAYELPPLKLVNFPKPTWPPPVASPILGHISGPRGHGLVLTGDQSTPAPTFAQWHRQRNMARNGDGKSSYGTYS